jgi:hypothetical protein
MDGATVITLFYTRFQEAIVMLTPNIGLCIVFNFLYKSVCYDVINTQYRDRNLYLHYYLLSLH